MSAYNERIDYIYELSQDIANLTYPKDTPTKSEDERLRLIVKNLENIIKELSELRGDN